MRRTIFIIAFALILSMPVYAMEFEAPLVPEAGERYMPENTETFSEGLWFVLQSALEAFLPEISNTAKSCLQIFAIMMLLSFVDVFPGSNHKVIHLAATVLLGVILLQPSNTMIKLGAETIRQMTEYGKMLFPVLTGALAAQGGVTTSAALYACSSFFVAMLSSVVTTVVFPLLYGYFCLSLASAAIGESMLSDLKNFTKWLISWALKIILYVFTAYIGITGVVSGTADASAVKIAKLTISGMVPVVGGIISDASETILVSAGIMKNAAGIYGILAIMAVLVGPLLKIGAQYLLLKVTAYTCAVFSTKEGSGLLKDFSAGIGMILAMTGTVSLLLLISIVCFMKGVS